MGVIHFDVLSVLVTLALVSCGPFDDLEWPFLSTSSTRRDFYLSLVFCLPLMRESLLICDKIVW